MRMPRRAKWEAAVTDLASVRTTLQDTRLLPSDFWQAFARVYPPKCGVEVSYHIEDFAKLLEGAGYATSIYFQNYGYEIDLVAIKDVFHISTPYRHL